MQRFQIAVVGNDVNSRFDVPIRRLKIAEEIGGEIAKRGAILICGGRLGVMKAASKGAKDAGGITVGILPSDSKNEANEFIDVVIPSGMGKGMRDALIIRASDAIIAIGGGVGTLREITLAYSYEKPVIGIKGEGGWTDKLIGSFLDERKYVRIIPANSPKEAVEVAIQQIKYKYEDFKKI